MSMAHRLMDLISGPFYKAGTVNFFCLVLYIRKLRQGKGMVCLPCWRYAYRDEVKSGAYYVVNSLVGHPNVM